MSGVPLRLRRIRQRLMQRAALRVETRRQAHAAALAILDRRDRALEMLDGEIDRIGAWLGDAAGNPALRGGALARASAAADERAAGGAARGVEAAAVLAARRDLDEARRALGRARARLEGVEVLVGAEAAARARRRDRAAELEQEDRRRTPVLEG